MSPEMNSDLLDRALRAYRVDAGAQDDRAGETLGRILGSQRRRKPLGVLWVGALACSAVAAAAIHELPRLRSGHAESSTVASAVPSTAPESITAAPKSAETTPPPLAVPAVAHVQSHAAAPAPVVGVSARRSTPAVESRVAEEAIGANDPEDALFEEVQRDHRSASTVEDLAGWQRYLTSYPDGRFAPEARYRRAEALARLGDENAALAAFLWFTRNPEGTSRREDALRWVRALTAER